MATHLGKIQLLLLGLVSFGLLHCNNSSNTGLESYLGQTPPDSAATIFAPDFICTGLNERDAAFTPDGNSFYFSVWTGKTGSICVSHLINGKWTQPEVAPFSGRHSDIEPFISPTGDQFFFVSNRPLKPEGEDKDYDIWVMDWKDGAWSEPKDIGLPINSERNEFYPSVTENGTLYFTGSYQEAISGEDIYYSTWNGIGYSDPVRMDDHVNSNSYDFNALIAPDESWICFSSWGRANDMGGGDLYISYQNGDGSWTPARNLGPAVNSASLDYCPALSPDGKYLFFSSRRSMSDFTPTGSMDYNKLTRMHNMPGNGTGDIFWISSDNLKENLTGF
ncbi:PD40 domain-containing protein [candidate division KSB1 bacterium]|nr:PD40 domain-containing protein [candidate division KSB1 bacterium]